MYKVVDSNFLQNPKLRYFLSSSKSNIVLLTEYAWIEAFKGDTLDSIYKSMEILADFPDQVFPLKNTYVAGSLSGRGAGLQKRFIDKKHKKKFSNFCYHLQIAKAGNLGFQQQLLDYGHEASRHIDGEMIADAKAFPFTIEAIAKDFTKKEIASLRNDVPNPEYDDLIKKLMLNVFETSKRLFQTLPNVRKIPGIKELPNYFIFRGALCAHLLALDWITFAGAKGAKDAKTITIRNDMVDANFVAFATYFDGLLSSDKKCKRIHSHARKILAIVYNRHI